MSKQPLNIKPRLDQVLIEERKPESKSGLVLPENLSEASKAQYVTHWIVAVGPDVPEDIDVNQRVILRSKAQFQLVDVGDPRFLAHHEDILALVHV